MNFKTKYEISNEAVEKAMKEKMELIQQNERFYEHLKSLGFNDASIRENISFIIDYFNDFQTCSKCVNPNECGLGEHYIKRISFENGVLNFEYDICSKYKKINRVKTFSTFCDISDEILVKNVGDIDKHNIRIEYLRKLLEMYQKNTKKLIFVESKKNSGGTFMTALFYKEIISKYSLSGAFLLGSKRLSELTDLLFNNKVEFARRLEELQTVDFLVINKISNYNFNEFVRNSILFPILEARISNHLTTIFTSEISYSDFLSLLKFKPTGKDVRFNQIKEMLDEFEKVDVSLNFKVY